jgi:RNA-directed DNA polymerase
VIDRACQALAKQALEPQWEAQFERNSYGFRPGRSAQDAIEAIFSIIKHKDKYVLDADIAGCFDNISHEELLQKLNTYPQMRRLIKEWLKAGVLEGFQFSPTKAGTPQDGVITPVDSKATCVHSCLCNQSESFSNSSVVVRYVRNSLRGWPLDC